MKYYEVVAVGSAVKDVMFYSDALSVLKTKDVKQCKLLTVEYGAKIPIKEIFINYGGGAMNVAVGLNNFGIFTAPMINVGKDQMGLEIYEHLRRNRIDGSLVNFDKEHKTGFSIIIAALKDKEHTIFSYKGASSFLEVNNLRNFRTKWFYVSALSNNDWAIEMDKVIRQTKRNVKIAWNPGEWQLQEPKKLIKFLDSVEVLILNKDEAIELVANLVLRINKNRLSDTKFLLRKIKTFGSQKVVITQGAKGAAAIDEAENYYYYPAQSDTKRIVDTVGAGDAFSSGLIAGLVRWNNFNDALRLAIRNSSHVLYKIGAQNGLLKIKL